ncbi:MAG: hypothetical protein ACPGJV_07680, partial [Bacteriovoracaceae bacterium]
SIHYTFFVCNLLPITLLFALITPDLFASRGFHIEELDIQLNRTSFRKFKKGIVSSYSKVESYDQDKTIPKQKLDMYVYGLHRRSCTMALPKISLYEKFKDYVDMIEISEYDEENGRINLVMNHSLLPFQMRLNFKLEKIDRPGLYKFEFDKGFLKGLQGQILAKKYEGKCLLAARAKYDGKKSHISDSVMEVFTETLSRITLERLIVVSR